MAAGFVSLMAFWIGGAGVSGSAPPPVDAGAFGGAAPLFIPDRRAREESEVILAAMAFAEMLKV